MDEKEYHILHYTGHGAFQDGENFLVLEDERGYKKREPTDRIVELLCEYFSLKLVFLSGCLTAKTSGQRAFSDLSRAILARTKVDSVVAKQYSISDAAGIKLAERFYHDLVEGKTVDQAMTNARRELRLAGEVHFGAEFATPVLLSRCTTGFSESLKKDTKDKAPKIEAPSDKYFISLTRGDIGFVGRRRELREIRAALTVEGCRAVLLHGLGGIGKTYLAAVSIDRLKPHFDFIYTFDCREGTLSPDKILGDLHQFFEHTGIPYFGQLQHDP